MLTSFRPSEGHPPACSPPVSCLLWLSVPHPLWERDSMERAVEWRGCSESQVRTLRLLDNGIPASSPSTVVVVGTVPELLTN